VTSPDIRNALAGDWPGVERLLLQENLPVDGLDARRLDGFLVALDAAATPPAVHGVVGLQAFGPTGLLRSLAVAPGNRGSGIGRQLVEALEAQASAAGVTDLWLLTIDAEVFFWKMGFRIVERDKAPDEIRNTQEFTSLCPGTAHLMHKQL
jgi:amino-acid N-acetyltransferase